MVFSRLPSRYGWETFRKDLPSTFLVQASKASRLQMNFTLPSLPWQVSHSLGVAAVIRHLTFETGSTARQVLGPHPKNNAVISSTASRTSCSDDSSELSQGQHVGSP